MGGDRPSTCSSSYWPSLHWFNFFYLLLSTGRSQSPSTRLSLSKLSVKRSIWASRPLEKLNRLFRARAERRKSERRLAGFLCKQVAEQRSAEAINLELLKSGIEASSTPASRGFPLNASSETEISQQTSNPRPSCLLFAPFGTIQPVGSLSALELLPPPPLALETSRNNQVLYCSLGMI